MDIKFRYYTPADFELVSDFLIGNYRPGNQDGNWLQPAWEYMHSHPALDGSSLGRIGIWEIAGALVGVVHYESFVGEVFFQVHPNHQDLKPIMLEYAEGHLWGETESGEKFVRAYVNDIDPNFEAYCQTRKGIR